jgi:hypothetical protein
MWSMSLGRGTGWLDALTVGVALVSVLQPMPTGAAGVVGDGTLSGCHEQALDAALAGGGAVRFACGGAATIAVAATKQITLDTVIDGGGVTAISGQGRVRIFDVDSAARLELRDVAVIDGFSGFEPGGGIRNRGVVVLDRATVSGNASIGFGGGLANECEAIVRHTTWVGNRATNGGGIANFGPLTVEGSLIYDNVADYFPYGGNGGGIANYGRLRLTNSTLARNRAFSTPHAYQTGYGGAIDNEGEATVVNCTMTRNGEQNVVCGGLHNNGRMTLLNTIVARSVGPDCCISSGGEFSTGSGANLTDDQYDRCGRVITRVPQQALRLRGLSDNGGATLSVAVEPGSVAVGAGDPTACADPAGAGGVDQRDQPRFAARDGGCDIGAVELPYPPAPTPTPALTALIMRGEPGEFVVGGRTVRVDAADARFSAEHADGRVKVDLWADTYWRAAFAAPVNLPLLPGIYLYEEATRFGFGIGPTLDVSGEGRGCNRITGRFLVREAVFAIDGTVEQFAVDFEQRCDAAGPALFGSLRIASNVPPASPPSAGPTTPPTPTPRPCVGDCDDDGQVAIGEIVRGVRIALGEDALVDCQDFDSDGDATVGIGELVAAIASALDGCQASQS